MIRQAISCDICGAEKKQTNHWFVTSEQGGELRVSAWGPQKPLRRGTKHLCGHTCLHKLLDEFMARIVSGRAGAQSVDPNTSSEVRSCTDASLTSGSAYDEPPVVALTVPPPALVHAPAVVPARTSVVVPIHSQPRPSADAPRPALPPATVDEVPQYASRRWCAEAWERERLRGARGTDRYAETERLRKGL